MLLHELMAELLYHVKLNKREKKKSHSNATTSFAIFKNAFLKPPSSQDGYPPGEIIMFYLRT